MISNGFRPRNMRGEICIISFASLPRHFVHETVNMIATRACERRNLSKWIATKLLLSNLRILIRFRCSKALQNKYRNSLTAVTFLHAIISGCSVCIDGKGEKL